MDIQHSELKCGECESPMVLRKSRFGMFYGCTKFPACKGTHGAHPDGLPLGVPANEETKKARIAAHNAFDKLWKDRQKNLGCSRTVARGECYAWLAVELDMRKDDCHIGRFDIDACNHVIAVCARRKS